MRKILPATAVVLIFALAAWAVGEVATDFSLNDLDGKAQKLSSQKGKVVVLSFWMTWCQACKVEWPHLNALNEKYGKDGLVLWGITADAPSDMPKVRSLVRQFKLNFTTLLDKDSSVNSIYNQRSEYPLLVLIDKEGKVAWVHSGFKPGEETEIEQQVKQALGK